MSEVVTDALVKPGMQAVLSRTHLTVDLHGFLLPIFEAISNAMDSIKTRFGDDQAKYRGEIRVRFTDANNPTKFYVSVTDNGVGLTEQNYIHFKTPFSGHKLDENGRGFGRFIAFKVFARIVYSSRYKFMGTDITRAFRFDVREGNEFAFFSAEPDFLGEGLCVEYGQPLSSWFDLIRTLRSEDVKNEIGSHFLPYFLYRWLPKITIQFDDLAPEDITQHFTNLFIQMDTNTFKCEIDGVQEALTYSLTRIPKTKHFKSHSLLFSAADRIVGFPRDLTNKLGEPHFLDEKNNRYIILAVVRGEAFEKRLNDVRSSINLSTKVIEAIVSTVSDAIQAKEKNQIEKIKFHQSVELGGALMENPILRLGLRGQTIGEYVATKPNNWKAEQFISDLAIERYRAASDLSKQIVAAGHNREDYAKRIKELVDKVGEGKKEALAEYVIHRKNIIALVEAARHYGSDGQRAPEEDIHELMFRRFSDNVATGYFDHNLWLIDDALAFLPYISSDRAMHGARRKKGDKVPDLIFFDDSLILGDEQGTTVSIVEFKRPSRNDYSFGNTKSDPVLQVIETLKKAEAAGGITTTGGAHISFAGVTRRFAFIIADLTPTFVNVLEQHDFKNDWNPRIFIRYRDNGRILIMAHGYDTLLENAKKRNQAFFSVLLGE